MDSGAVFVEPFEDSSLLSQKAPEIDEFLVGDEVQPRRGGEHAHHHLDGVEVKGTIVRVDEGGAEFGFRETAGISGRRAWAFMGQPKKPAQPMDSPWAG